RPPRAPCRRPRLPPARVPAASSAAFRSSRTTCSASNRSKRATARRFIRPAVSCIVPAVSLVGKNCMRPSGRAAAELRPIRITRGYTRHAEGSELVEFGETRVICTASVEERVPPFLKGKEQGWVTAEYGMLPRSTHERMQREAARGKQGGRTLEIQRLIGRALRAAVDLKRLGERTVTIDCDVLQADGGTRTAAITGGCVALVDALEHLRRDGQLTTSPLVQLVASISAGIYQSAP